MKNRKIGYVMGLIILCIIGFFLFYLKNKLLEEDDVEAKVYNTSDEFVITKEEDEEVKKIQEVNIKVLVDIKGAVVNPGVYEVDENTRVKDVIALAGGLLDNADTSLINLSKKVSDEMVIIVYTREEIEDNKCEDKLLSTLNDALVEYEKIDDGKISINTATVKDFMTINGIGEAKAKAIVEYRNQNGNFNELEDLLKVNGIGISLFEKIKDYLKL